MLILSFIENCKSLNQKFHMQYPQSRHVSASSHGTGELWFVWNATHAKGTLLWKYNLTLAKQIRIKPCHNFIYDPKWSFYCYSDSLPPFYSGSRIPIVDMWTVVDSGKKYCFVGDILEWNLVYLHISFTRIQLKQFTKWIPPIGSINIFYLTCVWRLLSCWYTVLEWNLVPWHNICSWIQISPNE